MYSAVDMLFMFCYKNVQEDKHIVIRFCPEYHEVSEMLGSKEQQLEVKAVFHKVMEEFQPGLLKIIDQGH